MAWFGEQNLSSVESEYWVKRWDAGDIGWHLDFVDEKLQVDPSLA